MLGVYRLICDVRGVCEPLIKDDRIKQVLPAQYIDAASRFVHTQDQNMSVASTLLKFHVVSQLTGKPWRKISFATLEGSGKPVAVGENRDGGVKFNVSHQAGLVVVIASCEVGVSELGVDLVNIAEKNDLSRIRRIGLEEWLLMFEEVLSSREMDEILESPNKGDQLWKLRHFYSIWALKEAYTKMTGEGLLFGTGKGGLTGLQFENLSIPRLSDEGERVSRGILPVIKGEKVENVQVELEALEENFMIASSIKIFNGVEVDQQPWEVLGVDELLGRVHNGVHKSSIDSRLTH